MVVRRARDATEIQAALDLRERVFCSEQGVAFAADRDGRDAEALHIVAVDEGRVMGTCRLLVDDGSARLGRLAVERDARGRGIGAAVLAEAHAQARASGAASVRLHAQEAARGLYESAGYTPVGEPFVEEGIAHVAMERPLA